MQYILPFGQAHGDQAWRTGPKAVRLSELSAAGFAVPTGFAITTDALDYFLTANGLQEEVDRALEHWDGLGLDELGSLPADLRTRLMAGELPQNLADQLRQVLDQCTGPVVLRSSSTMEDRADLSFAGQHDSFLNLKTFAQCVEALKKVWVSLYSDRAVAYLRALDMSVRPLRMGVVLQQLVPSQIAGVAFTVHPVSGDYQQIYISAALGLGESTVAGEVTPDTVIVGRGDKKLVSYQVGAQETMVVANQEGGTGQAAVEEGDRERALSEAQAEQVGALALAVEEQLGGDPQDIEWALAEDELYLLQARPMVQRRQEQGVVWEPPIPASRWRRNWRLGEWLPEAVTPLFSSWVLPMLVAARENFGTGRLGWKHRPAFSMPHPWFCLVNGYFYTRQDFPNFGGGDKKEEKSEAEQRADRLADLETKKEHLRHWHRELLPAYVEYFAKHRQFDIAAASGGALLEWVEELAEEAGEIWFIIAPIGYGFEGFFKQEYEKCIAAEGRVHYSVFFSGYPSRIFAAQQALYELAQRVGQEEGLAARLAADTPLAALPAWLRQSLDEYASEYGHQLASIDFFWPTSGENRSQLCQSLAAFARPDIEAPEEQRQRTAQHRDASAAAVLGQLEGDERQWLAGQMDYYQTNASVREDANFYFQLGWPQMRAGVLELGRRLTAAGVLDEAEEVFFLEKDELAGAVAALDTGAGPSSLAVVAQGRRRTWEERRRLAAPDVLGRQEERDAERGYFDDEEGKRIVAQGVSPGLCRGRVRFVKAGEQAPGLEKGEVLVTHAASPNLTPLMLVAGGLVVEVGGGASHSSLVARELGLPAVVDASQAGQVLRDGMLVEVDGEAGTVRIVED